MASIKDDSHLTSAAAFVEGGLQDCCDDYCSICLENFTESDPSTATTCKHEYHLQCILEWCQRSSQCPMCWQPVILKDPINQELLEAVELERNSGSTRNASMFHYPALGDFELQHLPVGSDETEIEERILRHLAAAAVSRRASHVSSREGQRAQSTNTHILVLSTQSGLPPSVGIPASSPHVDAETAPPTVPPAGSVRTSGLYVTQPSGSRSPPSNPDGAEPEFQSFSESLKSRFNTAISRHKELIAKSTRGWKERFFSRGNSTVDSGSGLRREEESVSRAVERLQVGESTTAGCRSLAPTDQNVSGDTDARPSRV